MRVVFTRLADAPVRYVLVILLLCGASVRAFAQPQLPACKNSAVNECNSQCGHDGPCLLGCIFAQDLSVDDCNNFCNGLGDNCVRSCLATVAEIQVCAAPTDASQVIAADNLLSGDSVVNLTNAGTRNGFDPDGGICANVYAFDPSEEMVACCACYVSPDGLRSLSVKQDVVNRTLTPGMPAGVTIKLLASTPLANSTCDPTSAAPGNLEAGMRSWGTSLHLNTPAVQYQVTENPGSFVRLSTSELTKLTTFCGFIKANGSGFGICNACLLGGLAGGAKQ